MKVSTLPAPGLVFGAYPERRDSEHDRPSLLRSGTQALLAALPSSRPGRYARFAARVEALRPELEACDPGRSAALLREVRARMARDGLADSMLVLAFALVRQACAKTLGVQPYAEQLIAARIMLDNRLAEMATGEGKTLAAAMAAASAALAGIPVHVVTSNDYLVARDAESMGPLYRSLGLSVGAVTQSLEFDARRQAYRRDIVYCTAKELVFDYLRDSLVRGRARSDLHLRAAEIGAPGAPRAMTLLRGLCLAVVDEADSILIDEARVPLILSQPGSNPEQERFSATALALARQMRDGEHFTLQQTSKTAQLTERGRGFLEQQAASLAPVWRNRMHREESLCTALAALHLYARDRDYLVHEGRVVIIDPFTGRLAPGRTWSRGLHQLIELKEGCKPSAELVTAAQMTYQRFFRRYLRLGGMSGTLSEARAELRSVYRLQVVKVPLRRPSRRRTLPTRLYPDRQSQWNAVAAQIKAVSAAGRPVLVGTDSVADSERLSEWLRAEGLSHAVLNARHDRAEAEIVARAGEPGRITIATNMAGRGTDIPLARGVAEQGGLHLICCQHNASARIDRQLLGRCARQGDPGSVQSLLSLEQPLISRFVPAWVRRRVGQNGVARPAWLMRLMVRTPQLIEEARQRWQRRALLENDIRADRELSVGRPTE